MKKLSENIRKKDDSESLLKWGSDWTNGYRIDPSLIVFPEENSQVSELVYYAISNKLSLVPSGGRTGLSGGAVASNKEIVVSFDRMNKILDYSEEDRIVKCQSGLTTGELQAFAVSQNLLYPVDFASSGTSQIGGNIATNAGGMKVIRYGSTRNWVAGMKVVTGKGEEIDLNYGLVKNATGFDLRHLMIGSEGTLGLICEAEMLLTSRPPKQKVILMSLDHASNLTKILRVFSKDINLSAFEFFSDLCLTMVEKKLDIQSPMHQRSAFYALVEFDEDKIDKVTDCFENCLENQLINDAVISNNETQFKKIWALRENISESISSFKPYKNDLSVKISDIPEFLEEVDIYISEGFPEFEVCWYGHIGDGNLHLNILKPSSMPIEEFIKHGDSMSPKIFSVVKNKMGSISAEHGVGLLKKEYLGYSRSEDEIEYMKSIKEIFDPHQILNPGKLFKS